MTKGLILLSALLLTSMSAMAQKVYVSDKKIYIDSRNLPAYSISTTAKPRTSQATNTVDVVSNPTNRTDLASKYNNNTVSHYFQVASVNKTLPAPADKPDYMSWEVALKSCYNETADGGGWRLPTHRELMLIWVLQKTILVQGGKYFRSLNSAPPKNLPWYWAATERSAGNSFLVRFDEGESRYAVKGGAHGQVRCVKDVAPLN